MLHITEELPMPRVRPSLIALLGLLCLISGLVMLTFGFAQSTPPSIPAPSGLLAATFAPVLEPRPAAVSQTLDGITLSVQPRYADLNRVTLNCTVSGPPRTYPYGLFLEDFDWARLSANGVDMPSLDYGNMGSGDCGALIPSEGPVSEGAGEGVLHYDASSLKTVSDTLSLHIILPLKMDNRPFIPPVPVPTNLPGTNPPTATSAPPTEIPPPNKALTFTIELNTPIDRRCRVAQVNKTIEAADVKITLDYVSVTASETRLHIRFGGNRQVIDDGYDYAWGSLRPGADAGPIQLISECGISGTGGTDGCAFSYLGPSLLDIASNQWTIRIDELTGSAAPPPPTISGPWTYTFTIPPQSLCSSVPAPVGTHTP